MVLPLNFHQTFAPEKEAIAQLVQFASTHNNAFFSKEEISQQTSIPTGKRSGKVVPHINYTYAMGLINFEKEGLKYKISLTSLGQIVIEEDPYFIEELTTFLCHYNLASRDSFVKMWAFIFNQVIKYQGAELTNSSLKSALNRFLDISDVNISPFRTCYTNDKCLGDLDLLRIDDDRYFFKPHRVDRTYKFMYGYLLLSKWEKLFPDQSEITYDILTDKIGFGNPFVWGDAALSEALEILQEERIIVLNRQLSPVTIIRQTSSTLLLNKIYSLLI